MGFLSIPLVGRERGRVLELFCAETHRVPGYRAVPIAMFTVFVIAFYQVFFDHFVIYPLFKKETRRSFFVFVFLCLCRFGGYLRGPGGPSPGACVSGY